jgi:ABC-type Mn2+/Zn2+ transport system ATPase subunit
MLKVENLSVGYDNRIAIKDINFTLGSMQKMVVIGANGCGKSAMLKTLVGILEPISGQIIKKLDAHIAYLGQFNELNLALPLSVKDFVMTSQYERVGLFGRIDSNAIMSVKMAMEFMEIDNLSKKPISSISGGQKQRAMLATVLAKNAQIAIMDEPTNNLDVGGIAIYNSMIELLISKGMSIIVSTHNLKEANKADLVAILSSKQTATLGLPSDVLNANSILQAFGVEL